MSGGKQFQIGMTSKRIQICSEWIFEVIHRQRIIVSVMR